MAARASYVWRRSARKAGFSATVKGPPMRPPPSLMLCPVDLVSRVFSRPLFLSSLICSLARSSGESAWGWGGVGWVDEHEVGWGGAF